MLVVIEVPSLSSVFRLSSLEAGDWGLVGLLSLLSSLLARGGEEVARRLQRPGGRS